MNDTTIANELCTDLRNEVVAVVEAAEGVDISAAAIAAFCVTLAAIVLALVVSYRISLAVLRLRQLNSLHPKGGLINW